jgi:hypothetical protein
MGESAAMDSASFVVSFNGPGVEDGRIHVRDLAPALLSLGRLIERLIPLTQGDL